MPDTRPTEHRKLTVELNIKLPPGPDFRASNEGRDNFDKAVEESVQRILTKGGSR